MNPEWIVAGCALATLLILWTGTTVGVIVWLNKQFKSVKKEILEDFNMKHNANAITVEALQALVMRHDILLNPEFNGTGKHSSRHQ